MFSNSHGFNKESTKIIFVLLSFAILGYTTFIIFRETKNMREEIKKLKSEVSEITEIVEKTNDQSGQLHEAYAEPEYQSAGYNINSSQNTILGEINSASRENGHGPAYIPVGLPPIVEQDTINLGIYENMSESSSIEPESVENGDIEPVFLKEELKTCDYVFKTGKKKGISCGTKTSEVFCKQHSKKSSGSKKNTFIVDDEKV